MEPYLTEWRGLFCGQTPLLLSPATVGEVSAILRLCHEHGISIVPQGGNTGLAGGAIPGLNGKTEVLVSSRRMNAIREIDTANYTMTVEAGCILAELQNVAAEEGLCFPLSLAAEGTCQIGGNISTNAGGTNVLHYGNTRDLVLGLEVVLPDGSVYEGLRGLRKDNSGYDLKQLFIGAEGTLGFITAATLKLFPAPRSTTTAWLAVKDPAMAVQLYTEARGRIGDELVAFELMPRIALDMVFKHIHGCRDPMGVSYDWYVLMELASAREQVLTDDLLTEFLASCLESGSVSDGVVASSAAQRNELWRIRHCISEAEKGEGGNIKHDISVPVSRMPDFLTAADKAMQKLLPGVRPVPFGHLGDGNLHYNLSQPESMETQAFIDMWSIFNKAVHSLAVDMDGSFSAEHGIGSLKADELERLSSTTEMRLMRSIKQAIDPHGIMNPGKVLK
ncbi:MAG: FAD-binding oxidoreductase [Gammaproteobacteria bacterium]|nr:FAD-binding oxidoreductase [Gammaproteobacteria bacterium]MCP4091401.1 FAD-binding oxidoreductase [Gammaproteobacteria bacterium]MCP4275641.1 FAD-binding oxidoreductase [Gammaproteobacteria bacterium]MCP4831439.1 FAD-binding oxidoreductase [Gammaproteobacteria bacterium]MCP4930213.1 FAD-binding oxidoreductase [Gammaproteobacteria bacterium]